MNWTESNILSIATKRLFYFDNEVSKTCSRICKNLDIDVFPDYSGKQYYLYDKQSDTWEKKQLQTNQIIKSDTLSFDKSLIESFNVVPSQILFIFDNEIFKGIVHFTDYGKKVVYQDLYKNFFEFEKKLKELLIIKGFNGETFINFFQYRAEKYPEEASEYIKKKQDVEKQKANYPLDALYTLDLLEFCYSSFHKDKNGTQMPFAIGDRQKKAINQLRNIVMHNKDNTGVSASMPHNYVKFKSDFFEYVQIFKETFRQLNIEIENYELSQKPLLNRIWLSNLDKLSDSELRRIFFDYEKYV